VEEVPLVVEVLGFWLDESELPPVEPVSVAEPLPPVEALPPVESLPPVEPLPDVW